MDEDKEDSEHEEKKLYHNSHRIKGNDNINNFKNNKSLTIQFYIIAIILVFLLYHFLFSPNNNEDKEKILMNSSKSIDNYYCFI